MEIVRSKILNSFRLMSIMPTIWISLENSSNIVGNAIRRGDFNQYDNEYNRLSDIFNLIYCNIDESFISEKLTDAEFIQYLEHKEFLIMTYLFNKFTNAKNDILIIN